MTLTLCPLIEYQIRNILWKIHAENVLQKLVPDLFLILVNNPKQPLHARNLTLCILSNPVPFNGQSYQKQYGPGTSDQSLFRLENKFRKIPLLVIYYLTKFNDTV